MRTRLLLLFLFFSLSFSAYTSERPWNEPYYSEYCPYVLSLPYFPEIWSIKDMQPCLEQLNLSHLSYGEEVSKDIEKARRSYGDAQEIYLWSISCSPLCFPGLPDKITFILTKAIFGITKPTPSEFTELVNYGIELILQAINPYLIYPSYWKSTANSALDALEKSFQINDKEWNAVYSYYKKMEYMGMCLPDYSGPGSVECMQSKQALSALGKTSAGRVGAYSRAFSHLNALASTFYNQKPDFSNYSGAMEELWGENGSINYAREMQLLSASAIESAETSLKSEQFSVEMLSSKAEASLKKLQEEKIGLITSPREVSTVQQQSFLGSLRSFEDSKQRADFHLSTAKRFQTTKPYGWLAGSLQSLQEAELLYSQIISEGPVLLDDAQDAVALKRQEALSAIEDLEKLELSLKQREELASLKSELSTIPMLPLGEQYVKYENIFKECKSIKEEVKSGSTAVLSYRLNTLYELMEKAEKDGIPLDEERQRLVLMEEKGTTLEEIQSIEDSIILKASIKYAQVPYLREQVLHYLSTGAFPDLQAELRKKELGLVYSEFSFKLALGSLHTLQEFYINILEEIGKRQGKLALASIITEQYIHPVVAVLDSPSQVSATLVATNPTDYPALDFSSSIPFPLPVLSQDLTNVKSFSYKSGILVLYFDLAPHESKAVRISKESLIASTTSLERNAEGKYGSAYVSEKRSIFLEIDCDALEVPFSEEGAVDGVPFYDSLLAKPIRQGKHTLTYSYTIPDAYTLEYSSINSSPAPGGASFSYIISATSLLDLDYLYIPIEYGASSEPITYHKISRASSYIILYNLKKGEVAKVRVFWSVQNLSSEIDAIEAQIGLLNLTDSEQYQFSQIKTMPDSPEKAKLLLSLKKEVEKRLFEEAKQAAREAEHREALSLLIKRYSSALELAKSLGEKRLSPTLASDLSALMEANATGADADLSIEKKRIKEFKKVLYDLYYTLKEKSYNCSSSVSSADTLFSSLELSPSLETAVRISALLERAESDIGSCSAAQPSLGSTDSISKEVEALISKYNAEFADAKELGLTSLLPYTPQGLESSYQKAKKSGSADLQRFKELLSSVIERLRQKAESSASSLEAHGIDASRVRSYINEQRYIKSIAEAQAALASRGKDSNLLVIGAVALLVLGAIAFLHLKGSGEKPLRKLEKV